MSGTAHMRAHGSGLRGTMAPTDMANDISVDKGQ